MISVLEFGDIEKRVRQEGQRGRVVQVTASIVFVDGEAVLQAVTSERWEMKRGADLTSIVGVIAAGISPAPSPSGRRSPAIA